MRLLHELRAWPLIVVLLPGFPSDVGAQSNPKLIGIKVGLTHSSSEASGVSQDFGGHATVGPVVGILGRRPLGTNLALQFELLATRKGANFDALEHGFFGFGEAEIDDIGVVEVRHTYLQAPVTLQYLPPLRDVGLRVYAGPVVGMTVSCSPDQLEVMLTRPDSGLTDERILPGCPMGADEFQVGLVGGALVDRPMGRTFVTLDIRYEANPGSMEGRGYVNAFPGFLVLPEFDDLSGFQATVGLGLPVEWQ